MTMIEETARRLEPLRPAFVRRWRLVRRAADSATRTLLDHELLHIAQQVLGDQAHGPMLSLPPPRTAAGRFAVGTVLYEQQKWPFGLRESELLQGLAVFGRSGAGKTNTVFHLLLQLISHGVPCLFLDWKRTARHLLPLLSRRLSFYTAGRALSPLAFSPFASPPGVDSRLYAQQVIDALAAAFTLGEGTKSLLHRALVSAYDAGESAPLPDSLRDRLRSAVDSSRARQWQTSAVRALDALSLARLGGGTATAQAAWVAGLSSGTTVIELDGLSISARQFLVPTLLNWVYASQLASPARERLQLVVIIEEAHHVLYRASGRTRESILGTLVRQCREVGIGLVVVDQHPHLLAPAALGNSYTAVCLNQKDPADISAVARLCGLSSEQKIWVSRLPVGQAIVKLQDRWREPFLVQVPPVVFEKGAVTDEVLHAYLNQNQAGSGAWRALHAKSTGFGRVRPVDDPPDRQYADTSRTEPVADTTNSPEAQAVSGESSSIGVPLDSLSLAFLSDVVQHPDDGVKARYRRLGWSMSKGTRIKNALIYSGLLDSEWLTLGLTRTLLLRLTPHAKTLLSPTARPNEQTPLLLQKNRTPTSGRESIPHEYWKRFIARQYEQAGYAVTLEAPRPPPASGRVDILAKRGNETIAIEIETGASNARRNIRQNARAGFLRIVVVANPYPKPVKSATPRRQQ
ncbi:MAG: DUF87 domain-containing protein [Phycisphaerae bacterium]|nr:DUF87 domain-containing protein [Phycisphaerae bacterium]